MSLLHHRDMTLDERNQVEEEAWAIIECGWSSKFIAVAILLGGSFVAGFLLFGMPINSLLRFEEGSREAQLALFVPAAVTLVFGGAWSVTYYLRGSWRIDPVFLDDLDYGRVEVLTGKVRDAWVVDDFELGTTWLLDLGDEVLAIAAPVHGATPRTFPGRDVCVVRCKHSGLVLDVTTSGPGLAPTGRLRGLEGVPSLIRESARFDATLDEVCRTTLNLAS